MKQTRPNAWTEKKLADLRKKVNEKGEEFIRQMTQRTPQGQDPYDLNFTQRESLAEQIGKQFASLLLQEHLHEDRFVQIVQAAVSWSCPRCQTQALPVKDSNGREPSESAPLKSKVGCVDLSLRQFCCPKCRKIFSPLQTAHPTRRGKL